MLEQDRSSLGRVMDQNIKIKTGESFKAFFNQDSSTILDTSIYLTLPQVKELWKKIENENEGSGKKIYLHEILNDSEIIIPKLEIPKRDPELEKRVQRLKFMQEEREYKRMTKNVDYSNIYKPEDSLGFQLKEINSGLVGVAQLVISIVAAFFFGFMGIEALLGLTFDLSVNLLLGIVCALIVGCAELYFLAVHLAVSENSSPTVIKGNPKLKMA